MKKLWNQRGLGRPLLKYDLKMKLTTLLLIIAVFGLKANDSYSQRAKINLEVEDATLIEIIDNIETSTEFKFIYKTKDVNLERALTLRFKEERIQNVLKRLFYNTNIVYHIRGKHITLKKVHQKKPIFQDSNKETSIDRKNQVQTITGRILDENNAPLPGANIVEKGTINGVTADFDGNFTISINDENAILVVSYIGYTTVEIDVKNESNINVILVESASNLDEVIVVGFGEKRKKDLTGSVGVVNSEQLENSTFASPQFALQGNTSGVRVINSSGDPNAPPEIYIRGIGSWQGNAQPLYVIDGQIITPPSAGNLDVISRDGATPPPNLFTLINPDDIQSITVLKDASSAAIYGSRGANGVILITTKSGRGKPTIEYNSRVGFQSINTWDVLNTQQFKEVVSEIYRNNSNPDISIEDELYGRNAPDDDVRRINFSPQHDPESQFYIGSNATYNWQKELVKQSALTLSHDVRFSGGGEKSDFYIGLGYDEQESNLVGNELKTYRASINVNSQVAKWLKTGVNYKFAYQEQSLEDYANLTQLASVTPWQPLYDLNNQYGFQSVLDPTAGNWQPVKRYGQGSQGNPLAIMDLNRRLFQNMRHLGQIYAEVTPFKGMLLRASVNLDFVSQDRITTDTYRSNIFKIDGQDPAISSPAAPNSLGSHNTRVNNIYNYQYDFTATYDKSFGNHNLNLTVALQDQYQTTQFRDMTGSNITNLSNLKKVGFSNDLANNSSILGYGQRFWFGYVGRASYNFNSKYYIDASYRRDASAGLAKDYRWGNFYSVAGAWRISSEPFMKNVGFINDLKLRGGYGEAGNDEVAAGNFAYLSTVSDLGSYSYGSGNGNAIGNYTIASTLTALPNPQLVWEVAETTYVGLDASLFDYSINAAVEVYRRRQNGIQQFVQLPLSVGTDDPLRNIGVLENRGIDLSLGYTGNFGDLKISLNSNLSFLENEVIELYNNQPLFASNQFGRVYRVEEGRPLGTIWGYKVGGIFQTPQQVTDTYSSTPDNIVSNVDFVAPGDMYFQDVQGDPTEDEPFYSSTPDGQVNSFDQTDIGNTIPGYTYGINLNTSYKGIDLNLGFYGEGDVQRYNAARAALESLAGPSNFSTSVLNRWTPSNMQTNIPRAIVGDPAGNNRYSDRFVESAAFFRLNNWQLGYSFPNSLIDRLDNAIQSLRIYIGGQNNIYINKWSGLDPVNDDFPLPRTYMLGLKVSL
ncbi:TonB-dependent receptor [Aurantibacter crassamenti]|uniref:TonB-dependent receptor n=1 Tax=Aurantibacter crassamenti TaxID=1837375 RepID=UPI00193A27C7|nr:TonB-dependent receptor [Aurantibacter crassamenti]MBM1105464.1 TonB-dependent receptor [Aurantibacter crassamenti]